MIPTHSGVLTVAKKKVDPLEVVRAVVKATHELTSHRTPPFWVSLDRVMQKTWIKDEALDAAVKVAVQRGWLTSDRHGTSVAVTRKGIALIEG